MENQEQVKNLISHLQDHSLILRPSETWSDRGSNSFCVRATFNNGEIFSVDIADQESIVAVKTLWQKNLKRVFAETSEFRDLLKLEHGKRYTLLNESELGLGVGAIHFTLEAFKLGRYAQYDNCIELIFKRKGARNLRSIPYYGRKSFAVFPGWIEINTDPFTQAKHDGIFISHESKYLSFDDRYMTDAIASAGALPLYTKLFSSSRQERSSL